MINNYNYDPLETQKIFLNDELLVDCQELATGIDPLKKQSLMMNGLKLRLAILKNDWGSGLIPLTDIYSIIVLNKITDIKEFNKSKSLFNSLKVFAQLGCPINCDTPPLISEFPADKRSKLSSLALDCFSAIILYSSEDLVDIINPSLNFLPILHSIVVGPYQSHQDEAYRCLGHIIRCSLKLSDPFPIFDFYDINDLYHSIENFAQNNKDLSEPSFLLYEISHLPFLQFEQAKLIMQLFHLIYEKKQPETTKQNKNEKSMELFYALQGAHKLFRNFGDQAINFPNLDHLRMKMNLILSHYYNPYNSQGQPSKFEVGSTYLLIGDLFHFGLANEGHINALINQMSKTFSPQKSYLDIRALKAITSICDTENEAVISILTFIPSKEGKAFSLIDCLLIRLKEGSLPLKKQCGITLLHYLKSASKFRDDVFLNNNTALALCCLIEQDDFLEDSDAISILCLILHKISIHGNINQILNLLTENGTEIILNDIIETNSNPEVLAAAREAKKYFKVLK